jgi:hypothetical protein
VKTYKHILSYILGGLIFSTVGLFGASSKKALPSTAPITQPTPKLLISSTNNTNILLLREPITPVLWEIKNPTSFSMTVINVGLSCGCTSYEWFGKTTLGPGERAWLVTYTEREKFNGPKLSTKITCTVDVPTKNGATTEMYTSEFGVNVVGTADVARSSPIVRSQQTITLAPGATVRQLDFLAALRNRTSAITSTHKGNKLVVTVDKQLKEFGHTLIEVTTQAGRTYIPVYSLP